MTRAELIKALEERYGDNACWPWPRKTDSKGRGRIWVNGKIMLGHRAVWDAVRGPIAPGKMLCHTCDNAGCVNPNHMYEGTHADNMRDMKERKRYFAARQPERAAALCRAMRATSHHSRGEGNPKAKLTAEQVLAIRADPRKTKVLAEIYGVNRTAIQSIRAGRTWKSLKAQESTQ